MDRSWPLRYTQQSLDHQGVARYLRRERLEGVLAQEALFDPREDYEEYVPSLLFRRSDGVVVGYHPSNVVKWSYQPPPDFTGPKIPLCADSPVADMLSRYPRAAWMLTDSQGQVHTDGVTFVPSSAPGFAGTLKLERDGDVWLFDGDQDGQWRSWQYHPSEGDGQ